MKKILSLGVAAAVLSVTAVAASAAIAPTIINDAVAGEEITEIAPYDNKEVVLNQLYGILGRTQDYSLSFTDPDVQEDGTVVQKKYIQPLFCIHKKLFQI